MLSTGIHASSHQNSHQRRSIAITAREFIETAPLYTRVAITDFQPPDSIMRMCTSKDCRMETTWNAVDRFATPQKEVCGLSYICGICHAKTTSVFYELLDLKQHSALGGMPGYSTYAAVRKVGQIPPQEIQIAPELSERLGDQAAHYRKALTSRGQNFGIGAMGYLRRVVDKKTDELIDVMAELSRAHGVGEAEIAKLLAVKKKIRYEEKLQIASELIPAAVRPGGVNPFGQLYKHTSIGLHDMSDDECISIFDDLKADFEYVFHQLHQQTEERRRYVKSVQERAGKTSGNG
jgi:hypothetical protein